MTKMNTGTYTLQRDVDRKPELSPYANGCLGMPVLFKALGRKIKVDPRVRQGLVTNLPSIC